MLKAQIKDQQAERRPQESELQRQVKLFSNQQDRLLNMRLDGEIDEQVFARKHHEIRYRLAQTSLQLEALHRSSDENAEMAV